MFLLKVSFFGIYNFKNLTIFFYIKILSLKFLKTAFYVSLFLKIPEIFLLLIKLKKIKYVLKIKLKGEINLFHEDFQKVKHFFIYQETFSIVCLKFKLF